MDTLAPVPPVEAVEDIPRENAASGPAKDDTPAAAEDTTEEGKEVHTRAPLSDKLPSDSPASCFAASARSTWAAGTLTTSPAAMNADAMIPMAASSSSRPPQFAVVHPQGFRILNNASTMERNMRGYFRLPQPPNSAEKAEQRRLQRTLREVAREEKERKAQITGNADGVTLDGFLILSACEAEDPAEVTAVTLQASHLTSSVQEDLQYFEELRSVDVSDNQLRLSDVLPFPCLETAHLVCNNITTLADVRDSDSSSLSTLIALDLAYNRIPAADMLHLSAFTSLQHLDLSNNGLRSLPADLSALSCLTHLALESNQLSSANVFYALSTLPALHEVNLARNRLSRVPLLPVAARRPRTDASVGDASGAGVAHMTDNTFFPCLRMLTVTGNRFDSVASLLPLAALHRTLRYIAVGENPFLSQQPVGAARQLQRALDEAVVDAYYAAKEPPMSATAASTAAGAGGAEGATWQDQTWVRYIPPRQHAEVDDSEASGEDGEGAAGAARSRASSMETAAPVPAAAEEKNESVGSSHPSSPPPEADDKIPPSASSAAVQSTAPDTTDVDEVDRLTVEEYVERYHIVVQFATPPPPPAKQSKRYFYSSAFRAATQNSQDATPLVTLPPYEEFMDIYRIVGRQRAPSRRKGHVAVSQRGARQRPERPSTLPVLTRPSPPPPAPPAVAAEDEGEEEEEYEESEEEGDLDPQAASEDADGFFLTGIGSEAANASRRGQHTSGRRKKAKASVPAATDSLEAPLRAAMHNGAAPETASGGSATRRASPLVSSLPRSVVSPANANVHMAMSELRAMLRKPLPSLPYEPARSRQER